jgi:mRNA-degrading endonuclease RelE of RelBE toxin-antitoxin system
VPAADQGRILAALRAMQTDPLSGDVVKLAGQDAFRRRVGSFRIIFRIDFKARVVGILDIVRRTTTTYR